jgi:hypothetical protein
VETARDRTRSFDRVTTHEHRLADGAACDRVVRRSVVAGDRVAEDAKPFMLPPVGGVGG